MEQSKNTTVARLEVRRGQGEEEIWEDCGKISLHDDDVAITAAAGNSRKSVSKSDRVVARRKLLPRSVKLLLSPNARIKAERRANFVYRHSPDGIDTNLIVLLHGAGDSHSPFHALAKRMALPQTASLSISASSCNHGFTTLPFGLGFTWFDEMDYLGSGNALPDDHPQRRTSLSKAVQTFIGVLGALSTDEGWHPERIFLFGFSAGACLAMETCLRLMVDGRRPLGGAICVAGGVKCSPLGDAKSSTSGFVEGTKILMATGSEDEVFPPSLARHASKLYSEAFTSSCTARSEMESLKSHHASPNHSPAVDIFVKDGKGHAMIESPEEMRAVMQFLAKILVRELPVMEGLAKAQA